MGLTKLFSCLIPIHDTFYYKRDQHGSLVHMTELHIWKGSTRFISPHEIDAYMGHINKKWHIE
jgi:hypothetical protein